MAHHADAGLVDHSAELFGGERCTKARNGFQLVDSAAGVPEAASAHFCHLDAAGRSDRRNDQRGLVAHAAGGMLVSGDAANAGQIGHIAGTRHGKGQIDRFTRIEPAQIHCHQKGGKLIIGRAAVGGRSGKKGQFFRGKRTAVALFADQISYIHISTPARPCP